MKKFSLLVGCGILLCAPALLAQQEPIIKVDITAISVLTGQGSIVNVELSSGGSGYTSAPTVTFNSGGGTGATATTTVSGGAVTSITLTNGGTGFTGLPTVTIAPPGTTATAAAAVGSLPAAGPVTGITLGDGGSGYVSAPSVSITGGGGTGALATATVGATGSITAINLTSGGAGYTALPIVTISAPGTAATAVVTDIGSLFRAPFQNESFGPLGSTVAITAVPSGTFPVGGYTLEFFVNGVSLGTLAGSVQSGMSGTLGWNPPQPGAYNFTVRAVSGAHNATSLPVRYFATGTALIGPTDNTLVPDGSSVVIQATATPVPSVPNAFVQRLEFWVDGNKVGEDRTYPYSYIYKPQSSPSTHTLEARAFDNNGNQVSPNGTAVRSVRMVTPIGTPPTVRILNPSNGSSVTSGANVNIIVDASSANGFIKNVDFFLNGVQLTSSQTFPFTAAWKPQVPGTYEFVAIAYDDKSNAVASTPVTITATGGFPTVAIATPSSGLNVVQGATVAVTVNASGPDGGISSLKTIELLVDGLVTDSLPKAPPSTGLVDVVPVLAEPFIFNWRSNVALGAHKLSARVTDVNGLTITSADVSVNVIPNQPPQIAITAPSNASSLAANVGTTITVAVSDPDGTVDSVDFFVDGASIGTATKAPFQVTWTPTSAGTFNITAKATDNGGAITTSSVVVVTVDPPPVSGGSIIANTVFRGDYGSATESGRFALGVNRNNRGTFIAFATAPAGATYFWTDFPVNTDGTFAVRDSAGKVLLSGQTSATGVSGTFDGKTFIGPITLGTTVSPLILSGTLAGTTTPVVAIVGGDSSITVYSATGNTRLAGTDFLSSSGSYTITTPTGGRITGSVTPASSIVSGAVSGGITGTFLLQQQPGRLVNISTRTLAGTGDRTLVAGFVVRGTGTKPLLIRAVGPTLVNFGVANPLADPFLSVLSSTGVVASNNDWNNAAALSTAAAQVGAFALNPSSRDAAVQVSVAPGVYTAVVDGGTSTPGAALIELYDTQSAAGTARIANISTRGQVGASDALIAGFVISGDQRKKLLIRAVGPTLTGFGIGNVLADPKVEVMAGTSVIVSNNDWTESSSFTAVSSTSPTVGAFPLFAGSRDAALVVQLNPGAYTVQVTGIGGATGTVLVEIYDADL
ncbi:MAG: Ig-like domain-containing protein [Opitutaceae bacterium]|nr:Ig-like domain-containing protein [Opitutaceae bacterium]